MPSGNVLYRWTDETVDAARNARKVLREAIRDAGISVEREDDVVLASSELVANAMEHARGPYEIRLRCTARLLVCEVVDHQPSFPASVLAMTGAEMSAQLEGLHERGRGLCLVGRLSCSWGVRIGRDSKVAWMAVERGVRADKRSTQREESWL